MIAHTVAAALTAAMQFLSSVTGATPVAPAHASSGIASLPRDLNQLSSLSSPSTFIPPMPDAPKAISLGTKLPKGATLVTEAQLKKIRTGTWVAVKEPRTTKIEFREFVSKRPAELRHLTEEFKPGAVPADLQEFYGGATCNHRTQGLWFEGSVLKTTQAGVSTLMACSPQQDAQDAEALSFIESNPKVYLDAAGHLYLLRSDGVASEWKRP